MVNIIKAELPIEELLKRKLELLRKIDRTNLTYIENLSNGIKLS